MRYVGSIRGRESNDLVNGFALLLYARVNGNRKVSSIFSDPPKTKAKPEVMLSFPPGRKARFLYS